MVWKSSCKGFVISLIFALSWIKVDTKEGTVNKGTLNLERKTIEKTRGNDEKKLAKQ